MGLRCGLALRFESNRTYLMSACYTLSRMENKVFCQTLIELKVPEGVRLYGLIYFRWMYPFERFMKVLKGYVQNRNHLKGCIVECYIVEKAIEFCTEYLSNMDAIRVLSSTNVDHKVGAPIPRGHITEVEVAIVDKEPLSETLRWIAHGPTHYVSKYHGYVINGCRYNTKDRDDL
uniref:DUF4218 domain-containing protein n=1 Tax=Vitis vinifera TaxID=29760 RepID=A5AI67_VITVI|nr:hypothetical protein VITISV_021314 [Vitis vinifera]